MINVEKSRVRMTGSVVSITLEVLHTLIAYKQMLDDNEPEIAGSIYDGIVVAGKYGDIDKANDYFRRESEKMASEILKAKVFIREAEDDEADQH